MNAVEAHLLLIVADETPYLISLEKIFEVLEPSPLSPVPGVPAWCRGALMSAGRVVPAIDLSMYMGDEPVARIDRIIVLDGGSGAIALLAGRVEDLLLVDNSLMEHDQHGTWMQTSLGRAEILNPVELLQEISAAMSR